MGCKKWSDVRILLGVGVVKLLSYGFVRQTGLLHVCFSCILWDFFWWLFGLLCWFIIWFFWFVVRPFWYFFILLFERVMSLWYSWNQAFIIFVVYRLFDPFFLWLWLDNHIDHLSFNNSIFVDWSFACSLRLIHKHPLELIFRTNFLVDVDLREGQRLYATMYKRWYTRIGFSFQLKVVLCCIFFAIIRPTCSKLHIISVFASCKGLNFHVIQLSFYSFASPPPATFLFQNFWAIAVEPYWKHPSLIPLI